MSPVEMIALSLAASVAVAGIAASAVAGLERLSSDAALRERAWGWALGLSALPPLLVAGLTSAPPSALPAIALPAYVETARAVSTGAAEAAPVASGVTVDGGLAATVVLVLAALAAVTRGLTLTRRAVRLRRLIEKAVPASAAVREAVAETARTMGVAAPEVRIAAGGSEALLTGWARPVLLLPADLAQTPGATSARAVIAHELAHLKRGDHRAVWVQEIVLTLLAVNPVLRLIGVRRAAAREEDCDALVLAGAEFSVRRAYAQSLIDALRVRAQAGPAPSPALTFTGAARRQVKRRMAAILTPPSPAARGTRLLTLAAGLALLGLTGAASLAVAGQRPGPAIEGVYAGQTPAQLDWAYTSAALDPVYRAAWPGACGHGSEGEAGPVYVYDGDACAAEDGPRIEIQTLEGVSPAADPPGAFAAVKAACDAGRPVRIAFSRGGTAGTTAVACAQPAVAPPQPVSFAVDLIYDPAIVVAAGDRLTIDMRRDLGEDSSASTGIVLNLAPDALPGRASTLLRPPLLPATRTDPMFSMTAKIVGADGRIKAVSDRESGRPFAPYLIGPDGIWTQMRMMPPEG